MKHFRLYISAAFIILSSLVYSQNLSVNFATTTLPSNVSDWSSNPSLITITLMPSPGGLEMENAHIVAEVSTAAGKVVASTRDKFAEQPALTDVLTAARTYRWPDIFNPNAVTIDASIKDATTRTGILPDGSFKLCVYLVDEHGQVIGSIRSGCNSFRVRQVEPPRLITPANNTTIRRTDMPKFTWTPVVGTPTQVHYHLKIVEVLPGQSAGQAFEANSAFFEDNNVKTNSLLYPSTAPDLRSSSGKLVWQVQALDDANVPVGKNRGKSAVGSFSVKTDGPATTVSLSGNGCTCGCGGTPRPYCAHADCKCAKAKQIIGDSATATAAGNGCDCGCGGTPRPYCAYKDCKCAKAKAILPDNTTLTSAGTACGCGCGGTPRPYCAHKDCQCAKAAKITGDLAAPVAAGNGCECGCGGTPRPYCAYKDCKCAKDKAILPDNTGTVTAGNGCTCGCGGTPRPLCAHKDCKCAQASTIQTGTAAGNGCDCGCGGTPRPLCAHKNCKCAKDE